MMERRVTGNRHARCEVGENPETASKDYLSLFGKIPDFPEKVATIRKYELSVAIVLQSLSQLKNMYEKNWEELSGNCDTTIYLGGGADTTSTKWISELLGKETRIVMNTSYSKGGGNTSYNRQGVELIAASELRTMEEDKCVVFMRSLDGYMGHKYKAIWHPMWGLKKKLGGYYFSAEKSKALLRDLQGTTVEQLIRQQHGDAVPETEEDKAARRLRNEMREQRAAEFRENKDPNGNQIISDMKGVNEGVFADNEGLQTDEDIPEVLDRTLETTIEEWGMDLLEYDRAPKAV